MGNVIKKSPNTHGKYRYIRHVDVSFYPESDWLRDPDVSGVSSVPEKYWKVAGSPESVVEMTAGEKSSIDADDLDHLNMSVAGTLVLEKSGYCANRWIGIGESKSSNSTPYIVPSRMSITAISFTNLVDGADTDIEIYRDGIKVHTWEVRNKRWAWTTTGLVALEYLPGDKLGVYLRDQGTNPRHVIVTLHYRIWSQQVGEGGSSTL